MRIKEDKGPCMKGLHLNEVKTKKKQEYVEKSLAQKGLLLK